MYNRCIRICSLFAASIAASSFDLRYKSIFDGNFASRKGLAPPFLFPGEHGLFLKLKCCNQGNNSTTISMKTGRSLLPSSPSPTKLPSYLRSFIDCAVLRGTPNFNACAGSDRLDRSNTSRDCLCEPASSDMAFHRSRGVTSLASWALGLGVGGASISGEWTMRAFPPPRFGVEYAGLFLLSVLGPVILPLVLELALPSCLGAFGVEGAIVGSRFVAFCVGYLCCCL